ncbi:MAG: hypothetical protein K6D96_02850 [Acetatifactor sp.]|nr:hypothetical protein [Acetatifactor sp.]
MEYGSVLELDNILKYKIPEKENIIELPFMKGIKDKYQINFYQSGRNAIEELYVYLKKQGFRKAIIPDYVCQTVKDAILRAGVEVAEYSVSKDFEYSIEGIEKFIEEKCSVYICHYFGRPLSSEIIATLRKWKTRGIIVVEDITLSLLSESKEGIGFGSYVLGSLRKWFPIPDGGFLYSKEHALPMKVNSNSVSNYTNLYLMVQNLKREYIDGECQDKALKNVYMGYYKQSIEELFSDYKIYPMSEWSYNYLSNTSVEEIIEKRIKNYDRLYNKLGLCEGIELPDKRVNGFLPFGMVLFATDRDNLLEYLISKNIYCNVHWRLGSKKENPDLEYLSKRIITIPCDQRYNEDDMDYIASIIREWSEIYV